MRSIDRDRRAAYIARFLEVVPEEAGGRLTGKNVVVRSEPEAFWPTVTMPTGQADGAYFGVRLDYDRQLTVDDPVFEVGEADVLWVDSSPGDGEPYDHVVKKVARHGDFTVIAAKRVEVRP